MRGMKKSPLYRYCNNVDVHHCPADMRTKRLKPGTGWAYDSYSKSDTMAGGICNMPIDNSVVETTRSMSRNGMNRKKPI